ncbi:MAG TPA: M1 family aminopeptidase [Bacteroidales bacterium]|nr:M1 family aminopeptidase [Bacteroidales bacterium]
MEQGKAIISCVIALVLFVQSFAQDRSGMDAFHINESKTFNEYIRLSEKYIPDTLIDVKFYYLDLSIAIDSAYIQGQVSCVFEPTIDNLSEIRLSLNSSLTVDQVKGNASGFVQTGDSIIITLDEAYNIGDKPMVIITYHGIPVLAGGYKGLRYETHHGDEPIIATLSTPYLAHYWYPCKDGPSDKADSVYVDITIPVKVVNGIEVMAVSNGILENVIDNTTEKTYQWRHRYPIVTYYVMAAISNYVHFGEDYTGIYGENFDLDYYVFQQDLSASQDGVVDLPLALDIFSEFFGEYPFSAEKYGMTQLGFYGAIENQTNTITYNMFPSWFIVSVHELGHMWFGDMITCANWHHGWLNEGFASYSEALYIEAVDGNTAYNDYMESFEYWNGGTLYLENANDTFNIFQGIIYLKGAYVLHMLRGVLGDSIFFDCLYQYSTDPMLMYGQALTEDFQLICENVSGVDLDYFFDQWVYDAYYPVYHYNFENEDTGAAFVIRQVQGNLGRRPLFVMPVDVKLNFEGGGDTTFTVWNDEIEQVFATGIQENVISMQVDPGSWILCQAYYHPEIPVSVHEDAIVASIGLNIYPQPMVDHAMIEISCSQDMFDLEFKVFDMRGTMQLKLEGLSNGTYHFLSSGLPSGIYVYTLLDADGVLLKSDKIIIQ